MIYTGYFDKIETYVRAGLTPVCIAGTPPTGYSGACYRQLAPQKIWWQEWHDKNLDSDWYKTKYYQTVLNNLSPDMVQRDIKLFGQSVVLVCYEQPGEFCHRHLVSQWLNDNHIAAREYPL